MKKNDLLIIFMLSIFGGILGSQILWPLFVVRPIFSEYDLGELGGKNVIIENNKLFIQEDQALEGVIKTAEKSSVGIYSSDGTNHYIASGVILTRDGLMITLNNALPMNWTHHFFVDGKERDYEIIKRDAKNNLALVKFDGNNFYTMDFHEGEISCGKKVFTIKSYFDFNLKPMKKYLVVDYGFLKSSYFKIIPSFERDLKMSGSPVFDIAGKLVGINKVGDGVEIVSIEEIKEFAELD